MQHRLGAQPILLKSKLNRMQCVRCSSGQAGRVDDRGFIQGHARHVAAVSLWVCGLSSKSGGGLPVRVGGQRPAPGHAHGVREVALLPVAGDRFGWNGAGDFASDCAHGGPGGQARSRSDCGSREFIPAWTAPLRDRPASTISKERCNSFLSRRSGCACRAFRRCWPR